MHKEVWPSQPNDVDHPRAQRAHRLEFLATLFSGPSGAENEGTGRLQSLAAHSRVRAHSLCNVAYGLRPEQDPARHIPLQLPDFLNLPMFFSCHSITFTIVSTALNVCSSPFASLSRAWSFMKTCAVSAATVE